MTVSSLLERTRRYIRLIDLRALSGLTRMLGVEFEGEELIRVTHVARKGMPLSKISARFEVLASLSVQRTTGEPLEALGGKLALALQEAAITTRRAVVGIPRHKMRTVEAQIPRSVRDENAWIAEHAAELLKLPVTGEEFAFRSVPIAREGSGEEVRISFVRNSDLDQVRRVVELAGLEACALVPGSDVASSPLRQLLKPETDSAVLGSASLAIAGFLPELAESDYLPPGQHEEVETRWAKDLFRRVAFAIGIALFILLLLEGVTSRILGGRLSELEEEHAALAPRLDRVEELDRRITSLGSRLDDHTSSLARTDVTRMLYKVASSTPGDVRLLQIRFQEEEGGLVTLRGYASGEAGVTRFLKDLSGLFQEVKLVRSKVARKGIESGAHRMTLRDKWEFEMRLNRKGRLG